jgi:hypothetical protein
MQEALRQREFPPVPPTSPAGEIVIRRLQSVRLEAWALGKEHDDEMLMLGSAFRASLDLRNPDNELDDAVIGELELDAADVDYMASHRGRVAAQSLRVALSALDALEPTDRAAVFATFDGRPVQKLPVGDRILETDPLPPSKFSQRAETVYKTISEALLQIDEAEEAEEQRVLKSTLVTELAARSPWAEPEAVRRRRWPIFHGGTLWATLLERIEGVLAGVDGLELADRAAVFRKLNHNRRAIYVELDAEDEPSPEN